MPTIARLAGVLVLLGASATWASAQEPSSKPRGTSLQGVVRDTARSPIEGAEVIIHSTDRSASTSLTGAFRLDALSPGRYWVTVRRIGYVPLRAALTLDRNKDRKIVFELEQMPHQLPEVEVLAEETAWTRRFREFNRRHKSAWGRFVTRDDIERLDPIYLADMVRRYFPFSSFNGFQPAGIGMMSHNTSWMTSVFGRASQFQNCPPSISVNGGPPTYGWALNDFRPKAVEALEIYRRAHEIPLDLRMPNQPPGCGLIVVWLRESLS
jgi:hypothetical protein